MERESLSVLDSSVVLKWFIDEVDSGLAIHLRDEYVEGLREIIIPDLLLYEISNALRYNTNFTIKEIKDSIDSIIDLEIEIVTPTKYLIHRSIEIARTDNITCYDAVFIALAVDIGDHVITADKKFHNSLSKEYKKHIKLLSDM